MHFRKFAISGAAFAISVAGAALAQEPSKNYVTLSGGVSLLMDSENEGAFNGAFTTGEGTTIPSGVVLPDGTPVGWTTDFDTGYSIGAAIGRRYGAIRGELEVAWQRNGVETHYDVVAGGIPLADEDAGVLITGSSNIGASVADVVSAGEGNVRTIFVMANAIYDFRNSSSVTPYIGAGAGVGFVDVNFAPSGVTIIDDNAKHDHIPDYTFELDGELVKIRPRANFTEIYTEAETPSAIDQVMLKSSTHEVARKFNGGWDVYFLEGEWRAMLQGKKAIPENPDGSFIGYVKWYVEKHGRAR